jgi:hypothetical protein
LKEREDRLRLILVERGIDGLCIWLAVIIQSSSKEGCVAKNMMYVYEKDNFLLVGHAYAPCRSEG